MGTHKKFLLASVVLALASARPQLSSYGSSYLAPEADLDYGLEDRLGSSSEVQEVTVDVEPVAILRSEFSGPTGDTWTHSFAADNGIEQETTGELKTIGDATVYVMRGSYSYPGTDGLTYVVDWFADETGFHPSAAHLPLPVEIPFPEQRAAVEAQLSFAAEAAEAAAAASSLNVVEVEAPVSSYSAALASDNLEVFAPLDSYSLAGYN